MRTLDNVQIQQREVVLKMQCTFSAAKASICLNAALGQRCGLADVCEDHLSAQCKTAFRLFRSEEYRRSASIGLPSRSSPRVRSKVKVSAFAKATARQSSLSPTEAREDWRQ